MKTIISIIILSITHSIYGQTGFIDKSFGDNGFVPGKMPGLVYSILQQQDGKLLAAGSFFDLNATVVRYLPDGNIDTTFGINGGASSNPPGNAYDMLLLKNSNILVIGSFVDENDDDQSFVARFKPNGKPDSSFGINGTCIIPIIPIPVNFSSYSEIALNTDGSIIIGGAGYNDPNRLDSEYTLISRLSADGVFDTHFGNEGYVLNLLPVNMKDLAIQPDGKIVTAGYNFAGGFQQQDFVFSRYNSDGSLDNSFGNNGNIIIDGTGGEDVPEKIIIQDDGKLVFGGYSGGDKYYMSALRFNSNGSLDKTFGHGGKVFVGFEDSSGEAYDMMRQSDGKFILAGTAYGLNGYSFGLCRINNNGSLDSSFGINGLQTTPYLFGSEAYCGALQTDNKIILGGYYQAYNGANQSYLIVRYNNDLTKKQILFAKIRRWLQHHNGIIWDNVNGVSSYAIQRSSNGVNWSTIHNEASIHHYPLSINNYYEDPSPLNGTNYYRLQTTSVDSAVSYSNIIAITNEEIKISPNPAKNLLHIEGLSSTQNLPAGRHGTKISVVDISGNIKLQTVANAASYNLNIATLQPGNYLLKIETNGEVVTKQFVKE